jgi:hypothetical protein
VEEEKKHGRQKEYDANMKKEKYRLCFVSDFFFFFLTVPEREMLSARTSHRDTKRG